MRKSLTTNNFKDGLIMDINPMQMPNTAYVNGLNVTLITKDGNEHILQNDMGNGRVETAYLPEGYIPLGTCSLGGIIYVASYNPLKDKGQIGCFPSPERNISSDEDSELNIELTNSDFLFTSPNNDGTSEEGAQVYYLKKQLWADRQFNPGDKFIVYGSPIAGNFEKLWIEKEYKDLLSYWSSLDAGNSDPLPLATLPDEWADTIWELLKSHTVRLSIGTITNTGKLIVFSNLKEYDVKDASTFVNPKDLDENLYQYLIFEYAGNNESLKNTDLDDYRSLVSQPYNVFNSKISGQLVLIAELVQFNDFDMTITNKMGTMTDNDGNEHKTYEPIFNFNYEGDYPYIPYGAECEFQMTWKDDQIKTDETKDEDGGYSGLTELILTDYNIYDSDDSGYTKVLFRANNGLIYKGYELTDPFSNTEIRDKLNDWSSTGFFDNKERNSGGKIRYLIKPSMIWGPVTYLQVDGLIDLDKIGTGYIGITQWRYYNDDNTCTLNWGLEVYEEDGYEIKQIVMRMTRVIGLKDSNNGPIYDFEVIDYYVDTYSSYFGTFTENIPLNSDYFKVRKVEENTVGEEPDVETNEKYYKYYQIKSNQLYFVDIQIWYLRIEEDLADEPTRHAYRWLYTNGIFNSYYGRSQDFGKELITFDLKFSSSQTNLGLTSPSSTQSKYGLYFKLLTDNDSGEPESSHSVIQNEYTVTNTADIKVGFLNDYDTFDLDVSGDDTFAITVSTGEDYVSVHSSIESAYTGNDDNQRNEYMPSTEDGKYETKSDDYNLYKDLDSQDDLFEIPHTVYIITSSEPNSNATDNTLTVTVNGSLLQTVRGYTTPNRTQVTINGMFRPLAYNQETFRNYGLEWASKPSWLTDLPQLEFVSNTSTEDELTKGQYTSPIFDSTKPGIVKNDKFWQFKLIGLFGQIELRHVKGISYGYVCLRDLKCDAKYHNSSINKNLKFLNAIEIEKNDSVGFHFLKLDKCADTWKTLGLTHPIEFFMFYFGGRYDSGDGDTDGTDSYCWPNDKHHRVVSLYNSHHVLPTPNNASSYHHPYMIFLTMRDISGSYYLIPLNLAAIFNLSAEATVLTDENDSAAGGSGVIRNYPGYFSYYGFPHLIAQWLTNIYIYTTDEIVSYAYIPLNVYWETLLVSYVSIPIKIKVNNINLNLKKVYLKLDDGSRVDLHDMYKIMADKYGTDGEVEIGGETKTIKLIELENESEKEITEKRIEKNDSGEDWLNDAYQTDILHPNIDYIFNDLGDYELSIDFNKSDQSSGSELYKTFSEALNTVLVGAVMDWDGITLINIDQTAKRNSKNLYMRNLPDNDNKVTISLASNFIPYLLAYNDDDGVAKEYWNPGSPYPLDGSDMKAIDLNRYFVIDNGKIYLNDEHTVYNGDFKLPIYRENDSTDGVHDGGGNVNTYCDGIVDITIFESLKIPNT